MRIDRGNVSGGINFSVLDLALLPAVGAFSWIDPELFLALGRDTPVTQELAQATLDVILAL